MGSTDSKMDALSEKIGEITLAQDTDANTLQASDYYETRQALKKVNFARLEKGLLLFIYIHETTKNTLHSEMTLWNHHSCIYLIKDGHCLKPRDQCRREHDTSYRQSNICSFWYTSSCTYQTKCRYSHDFLALSEYHHYILTGIDSAVCKLIGFVRNFAGHYIDSAIKNQSDVQELHKEIVVLMVHLVHALSPKRVNSLDHLNLFLEATTIKQLIPQDHLLQQLQNPYDVPEVFFESTVNFNTHWYRQGTSKRTVNFSQISSEFVRYFNGVFVGFYEGRLKSRGALAAWT